jgi:hypothetical protein
MSETVVVVVATYILSYAVIVGYAGLLLARRKKTGS